MKIRAQKVDIKNPTKSQYSSNIDASISIEVAFTDDEQKDTIMLALQGIWCRIADELKPFIYGFDATDDFVKLSRINKGVSNDGN